MIAIILGFIGFFISDGTLGVSILNGLSWMDTWLMIILWIIGTIGIIVSIIVFFAGATASDNIESPIIRFLGGFTASGVSMLVFVLIALKTLAMLVIVSWLSLNIDPTITEFSQLSTKEIVGLIGLILIPILFRTKGSSQNSD